MSSEEVFKQQFPYRVYDVDIFKNIWKAACEYQKEKDALLCEKAHNHACQQEAAFICARIIRYQEC